MNKKDLIKTIKENLAPEYFYNLELYKNVDCDSGLYLHFSDENNKTLFNVDILYYNNKEKKEIYKRLITIIKSFGFSFTLEFNNLIELREWTK